ncbi:hypothetical protein HDU76_003295 [Blyttiomyces sp. JEL0837]|nr:hypothetical protein HDU76_003295 [Blyttiomyces sp. JEL0837]
MAFDEQGVTSHKVHEAGCAVGCGLARSTKTSRPTLVNGSTFLRNLLDEEKYSDALRLLESVTSPKFQCKIDEIQKIFEVTCLNVNVNNVTQNNNGSTKSDLNLTYDAVLVFRRLIELHGYQILSAIWRVPMMSEDVPRRRFWDDVTSLWGFLKLGKEGQEDREKMLQVIAVLNLMMEVMDCDFAANKEEDDISQTLLYQSLERLNLSVFFKNHHIMDIILSMTCNRELPREVSECGQNLLNSFVTLCNSATSSHQRIDLLTLAEEVLESLLRKDLSTRCLFYSRAHSQSIWLDATKLKFTYASSVIKKAFPWILKGETK